MAIGAYGGEHIGDIAILGGVLLRISKRYGATHAVLMSQRARHTRHLVPMLDSAVSVTVESYEAQRIRAHLPQVDALVYAGGPLMDIPKQLVKHLYAVSIARRMGKPFIVEGIGAGPFKRLLSAWSARRTVRMARSITLRTRADNETRLVRHLDREVGHDPAFDYLATRPAVLTRLRDSDRNWLDVLLENAADTLTVGVNLRPIRPFFTEGVPAPRRLAHTRAVEQRFERQLAEGLREFSRTSNKPPRFIFFPMNAIQAGMSDLRSAYRLFRLLGGEIDFRVWEGDASLDGVISLLRRLDIVISMRFHATIFALSQGCRVIGVDYRIGERDKVAALLEDFGQADNCRRIDQLTADWLASRLSILSRQPARAHPTSDDVSAR
jgi:polysaccharide pyruvyl transferase WcaK-like protein